MELSTLRDLYSEGDDDLEDLKEAIMNLPSHEYPGLEQLKAECAEITEKRRTARHGYDTRVANNAKCFEKYKVKVHPRSREEKMAYAKELVAQAEEESIGRALTEEEKQKLFSTREGLDSFLRVIALL